MKNIKEKIFMHSAKETKDRVKMLWVYKNVKLNQSHYRPGSGSESCTKLRFPDFMTKAQDGGRLSALRTGRFYPRKYSC